MLYQKDMVDILDRLTLPEGWTIRLTRKGDGFIVQILFFAMDSDTGEHTEQRCRKWYVSSHATVSEVVRTVYKAGLAALEHEFSETFKYRGVPIYHPHRNVEELHVAGAAEPGYENDRLDKRNEPG